MLPRAAGFVAVVALTAAVAACGTGQPRKTAAQSAAVPARGVGRTPAAAAGGVCELLDFYVVEQLIGVQFEVAASAQRDDATTCVLQRSAASYPDLMLAVSATGATAATFRGAVPAGATEVPEVGQVAYQLVRPAPAGGDAAAPGGSVEVAWLTRTSKFMMVRYRFPAAATDADVAPVAPRMVELARFLDPR